ncbi:hypothetical protein, partial [Roseovarius sp. D22-M7]|uniref:hypothetical protein n=1 Tax=Roseovarius sp. D22-M7 TaxID=3127116 RepID=UPI003010514B
KCAKPDRKGARARFGSAISALANFSFSTESAVTGLSLRWQGERVEDLGADIQIGPTRRARCTAALLQEPKLIVPGRAECARAAKRVPSFAALSASL